MRTSDGISRHSGATPSSHGLLAGLGRPGLRQHGDGTDGFTHIRSKVIRGPVGAEIRPP